MNGAFRPKGGNGVHGLFDDAGNVSFADKGGTPEGDSNVARRHLSQMEMQCKIRLLRNHFAASQREAPSGGILFLFVKKEYAERHAKGPFVLWNLRLLCG